jgi:hypothetical protein
MASGGALTVTPACGMSEMTSQSSVPTRSRLSGGNVCCSNRASPIGFHGDATASTAGSTLPGTAGGQSSGGS